jgi:hypothetical protein
MLGSAEIARGIQGAIKILLRDASAPLHFDNTPEACLRSFRAMVLAAPVYALYIAVHYMQTALAADEVEIVFVEALHFVVDWLLYPVLFFEIARRRGWLERYPRYIAALNWINLPILIVVLVFEMVASLAGANAMISVLGVALQAAIFYWLLTAARLMLGVGWGMAVVLLIVNWVPSYLLLVLVNRLLGVGAAAAASAFGSVSNFL